MTTLTYDVETTIFQNGNAYSSNNKLCYIGMYDEDTYYLIPIEFDNKPYAKGLQLAQELINKSDLLIGFNLKFDIAWGRRYGLDFSNIRVYDEQLVHFILTKQVHPYPSLNSVASYYGLGTKIDVVSTEYWDKGIDTPSIPKDILEEYLEQDLQLTYQIYQKQKAEVSQCSIALQRLILLHNADLLVLQEMEYNGLIYNEGRCLENAETLAVEIQDIDTELVRTCAIDGFNFNSGDHLSCLLYGGTLNFPRKEIIGVYKTGERKGEDKYGWVDYYHTFPQLVTPLKGTELKKEGYYSTDEQTLKSLKGSKEARIFLDLLLKRSLLDKRRGTYFAGFPKLREEHGWKEGYLHGQLNQCVARTGRLSSSKPNLQNIDSAIKDLFFSRYS